MPRSPAGHTSSGSAGSSVSPVVADQVQRLAGDSHSSAAVTSDSSTRRSPFGADPQRDEELVGDVDQRDRAALGRLLAQRGDAVSRSSSTAGGSRAQSQRPPSR